MSERVAKSVKIDPNLWKEVKLQAVKDETTISGWVEDALKRKLEEGGK